jgi:hypothetical protein
MKFVVRLIFKIFYLVVLLTISPMILCIFVAMYIDTIEKWSSNKGWDDSLPLDFIRSLNKF